MCTTRAFSHRAGVDMAAQLDRRALARAVKARRIELRLRSQEALASAAGLDTSTVGKIERGLKVSDTSLTAIDLALGWELGSAERTLHGGRPTVKVQPRIDVSSRHLHNGEPVLIQLDIYSAPLSDITRAGELIGEARGTSEGERFIENVLLLRRMRVEAEQRDPRPEG